MIVPSHEPALLAEAFEQLISLPVRMRAVGVVECSHALKEYSPNAWAERSAASMKKP